MSTTRNIIEGIKNVTSEGVTKAQVGLGSVDNTSDTNKPVSTATQTALNGKAPIASPVFTGDLRAERLIAYGSGNISTNVAVGFGSLTNNTTGEANIAIGYTSLHNTTTGSSNSSYGAFSMQGNTTGSSNSSYGRDTMISNATGSYNSALGRNALRYKQNGDANTDLSNCTGLGYNTKVGGNNATAVGYNASAPASCVALGTSSERTLVAGAVDNGVDRLQVNGSVRVNSGGSETMSLIMADNGSETAPFNSGYYSLRVSNLYTSNSETVSNQKPAKIQFETVTRNGWGATGAIMLLASGTSDGEGDLVFTTGAFSPNNSSRERLRIYGGGKVVIKQQDYTSEDTLIVQGGISFRPLTSVNPSEIGDLTFEATSNTSVKIKLKGSDGTIRSTTLTLS